MSTEKEILGEIAEYLGLSLEDLDRNASLQDELGLSPIEVNDLLAHLSQKFAVAFKPEELENIHKVEDIISLVEDNLLE